MDTVVHRDDSTHRVISTSAPLDPRWDRFVESHPAGSTYLQSGWLRALSREVRMPQFHLACEDDHGELVGVLPLVATRGMPFGGRLADRRWSSLPRTPVGGPVATTDAVAAALVACAARIAEEDGVSLQLKRRSPDLDGLVPGVARTPWRVSLTLGLPTEFEHLRFGSSRNHRRIRTAVHKAERSGVRFRVAGPEDLDRWYRLYLDTMRWHCVPARPRRLFATLLERGDMAELLVVEQRDVENPTMLAGAVVIRDGSTLSYAFNGVDRSSFGLRPNEALQWNSIKRACELGYRWYDFGEVSSGNEGLRQFKRKWGADEVALHHYYCPPVADTVEVDDEPLTGRLGTLARAGWRRVPLWGTALVGGVVNARL